MRLTVVLRDGESWRIPVKHSNADVRWLIDEVSRRHERRRAASGVESSGDAIDVAAVSGVRRENSAILELDDILGEHCRDGETLTALYTSEAELVEGFTSLLRDLSLSPAHGASVSLSHALASNSDDEASYGARLARQYESKLHLGFDDDSEASAGASTANGREARSVPSLRSSQRRLIDATLSQGPRTLSVLASTDGDRVDVGVQPNMTAKDVIAEVVHALYGQIDKRRHYGLATLDGVLVGPAMPVADLFGASRRRARVVLVYPPDETEDESSEYQKVVQKPKPAKLFSGASQVSVCVCVHVCVWVGGEEMFIVL